MPTQTGHSGKYLTTDGTTASWAAVTAGTVTSVGANAPLELQVPANASSTPVVQFTPGSVANDGFIFSLTNGNQPGFVNPATSFVLKGGQTGAVSLGSTNANAVSILTNNTTRMTVDSAGNVGIGTTTPGSPLTVSTSNTTTTAMRSAAFIMEADPPSNSAVRVWGTSGYAAVKSGNDKNLTASGNPGLIGVEGTADHGGTGVVTLMTGMYAAARNISVGTVTNASGLRVVVGNTGGGALTNGYGIYVGSISGTNRWAIYSEDATAHSFFAGNVGIGTTNPTVSLDLATRTDAIRMPAGTTAQQPASPAAGMIRWNTTNSAAEIYNGTAWASIGVSGSVIGAGAGTASAPSLGFSGDTDTGLFSSATDTIGFSTGGTNRFNLSSAGLVSTTSGGGLVTSAAGTASAPTFSFAGDPDTGWFSPAANTLAAATGGSERVRIDSSGNVRIGTTTTSIPLHVQNNSSAANQTALMVAQSNLPTGSSMFQKLGVNLSATYNAADLTFFYNGSGSSSNRFDIGFFGTGARFSVQGDGNVGIGTTGPSALLDVYGGSATYRGDVNVTALFRAGGLTTNDAALTLGSTNGNSPYVAAGQLGNGTYTPLDLKTSGTTRVRVDASGNVGIGTTNPAALLTVGNSPGATMASATGARQTIRSEGSTTGASLFIEDGNINTGSTGQQGLYVYGRGSSRNADLVRFSSLATSGFNLLHLASGEAADGSGASTRMVVSASGNVGIGTTSPNAPLEISRDTGQTAVSIVTRSNTAADGGGLVVYRSRGNHSAPTQVQDGDRIGYYSFANAMTTSSWSALESYATENHTASAQGMDLRFRTVANGTIGGSERMRITNGGNVGIGTTNPAERLDVGGGNVRMGWERISNSCGSTDTCTATCTAGKRATGGSCNYVGSWTHHHTSGGDATYTCNTAAVQTTITVVVYCANIR